jgi:hypothetical protein
MVGYFRVMKDTSHKKRKFPEGLKVLFIWIAFYGFVIIAVILWKSAPQSFREILAEISDKFSLGVGIIILVVLVAGVVYSAIKSIRLFRKNREDFHKSTKEVMGEIIALLVFMGIIFVLFIIMGLMDDVFSFIWKFFRENLL